MSTVERTAALVGVTGGAGTTRLAVEMGATLVRAGHSVAVLDAAFATQGLARHVSGRIDADLTTVLVEADRSLDDALVEHPDTSGRLALCPSYAPFERLARAKTPDAAERFQGLLREAADAFDYVLVDVPPVATNPAVAAVTTASRVALVTPPSARGVDAVQRTHGRLADVGTTADRVVANRAEPGAVPDADVVVPESDATTARDAPASTSDPDDEFAPAVAAAAEAVFDASLDLSFPEDRLLDLDDYLPNLS